MARMKGGGNSAKSVKGPGSKTSPPLVWFRRFLFCGLTFLFAGQSHYSLRKYLRRDTGSALRLTYPELMPFPSLTLCPLGNMFEEDGKMPNFRSPNIPSFISAMQNLNGMEYFVNFEHSPEWISR